MVFEYHIKVIEAKPTPFTKHGWQVRIEDDQGKLIGIPIRDVTEKQARASVPTARAAFEYGLNAGRIVVRDVMFQVNS